jgi:phenylpropionate dioxygenase-like ring-hydroxylating dioxygenase large terminal subunit
MAESNDTAPVLPKNHWYIACASSKLRSTPRAVRILDEQLVVFRTSSGAPSALEDRCPHRQAPLSCGRLRRDTIECAYHGWRFDAGGHCVEIPSLVDGKRIPEGIRVPTRTAIERRPYVWVWMGDGPADASLIPEIPHLGSVRWNQGSTIMECNAVTAIENFFDPVHTAFLHRFTHPHFFRRALGGPTQASHELRVTASGLIAFAPPTATATDPVPHTAAGLACFDLPNHASLEFSLPWQRHRGHFFYVPEGSGRTRVEWLTTKYIQLGRRVRWRRHNAVLEQDRSLLEQVQKWHERRGRQPERSVEADAITLTLNKILRLAVLGQWQGTHESIPARRVVHYRS